VALNLGSGFSDGITAPMILSRTDQNTLIFGAIQTAGAVGGVVGGLIMTAWGGFKKRTLTMLAFWPIFAIAGHILFGISRWSVLWIASSLVAAMTFPITNGAAQAIWQAKVAPDVQGRVFSARRFIAWFTTPIMPLVAGSLADLVTEPAMRAQTPFSQAAAWLVGNGPGSGMGLQFILSGILFITVVLIAFLTPAFRNMETIMPDHDQMEKVTEPSLDVKEKRHEEQPQVLQEPA
jgi:DHA3 family macrolide efflux protein-like MFS transporter